jgi:predicted unusual protein kinase regulating ubiquinone biosynthesis (AarF/ABC1/UbiB family)
MSKKSSATVQFSRAPNVTFKMVRFCTILGELLGFLLFVSGQQVGQLFGVDEEPEVLIRAAAENALARFVRLGPTFIKGGQIMSTRGDIFPPIWIDVLSQLQADVPPVSYAEIEEVLQKELQERYSLISSVSATPLKAASIGQVHRAWLSDGREVVLKIQRPEIESVIRTDLAILRSIAFHCSLIPWVFAGTDLLGTIDQLAATFQEELDYKIEATNYREFRDSFRNSSIPVIVPGVIDSLSGARVLALDFVPGTSPKDLRAPPGDVKRAIRHVVDAFLYQLVETGIFHADPHPGNIAVHASGRIIMYDCGMLGRLPAKTRQGLADIATHAITADAAAIVHDLAELGILSPDAIGDERVIEAMDAFLASIDLSGISGDNIGVLVKRLVEQTDRGRLSVPREFVLLGRCLIELEGLLALLGTKSAEADYRQLALAQASAYVLSKALGGPIGILQRAPADMMRTARLIRIIARTLQRGLRQFETGQLKLPVRDPETARATRRLSPGIRSLNAAVLFGTFSVLSGLAFWDDRMILGVPLLLGGLYFMGRWLVSERRMES